MGKKADYGQGHPAFLEYAEQIVQHKEYQGMPDLRYPDGRIQWEAPSNRKSGIFKDSHIKRKEWWEKKAISIGVDTTENQWISKTAKLIHPTMKKPCKRCGSVMDLRYSYPTKNFIRRIRKLSYLDESFEIDSLEHVLELIKRLVLKYGEKVFVDLPKLLTCKSVDTFPKLERDLDTWLNWIDSEYIPKEPSMLSPGAMANPPDRLDGFHTLNECCRSHADSGRWKENLLSYTTDRRAFEYWVDGDWVAADKLMGVIRTDEMVREETCLYDAHEGPCSADHIGPISLGFAHRPVFQLLCSSCNSAKNNRMTFSDVQLLIQAENNGEEVASWYCKPIWDLRKNDVINNETALRLSKILRDNRHTAMSILSELLKEKHYLFLSTFLGLHYAERSVSFSTTHIENHIVSGEISGVRRETKYTQEQKARRIRIGFEALMGYIDKEKRNALLIINDEIINKINTINRLLKSIPTEYSTINKKLSEEFSKSEPSDELIRKIVDDIPTKDNEPTNFKIARKAIQEIMKLVGEELSEMWDNERYVRQTFVDLD